MRIWDGGEAEVKPLCSACGTLKIWREAFGAGLQARPLELEQGALAFEALSLILAVTERAAFKTAKAKQLLVIRLRT